MKFTLIIVVLVSFYIIAGTFDHKDTQKSMERYCENVETWNNSTESDPLDKAGHPDYKGIYADVCK